MNTKILNVILGVFIVVSTLSSHASDVIFHNINAMHGISLRETSSMCSDDYGFIWASSKTGILRLTGDDYRIYRLPYQTADNISIRLVYKKPVLLAFTNNGQVFRYNSIFDRFDFFIDLRKSLNTKNLHVNNILIDNQRFFWISSNLGIHKYQGNELILVNDDNTDVSRMIWYDALHLLFTRNNKLWLMDIKTLKCDCIYENQSSMPLQIRKFYYDPPTKKLWIGTLSKGLFRYDFNTRTFSKPNIPSFPKQPVLAIEANSDSTILVGIDGQGIWEVDKNTDKVLNIYKENADNPSSLQGDGVYDIFCDRNKRIWVCTFSGGVSFFDQKKSPVLQITHQTNNPNSLSNNHINKIVEDSRGKIWFATNNGISCWDLSNNQWKTFYHNEQAQVFLSLCEDDKGRIWAGAFSSGVYVLDGKTGKEMMHYSTDQANSPINNYIFDIYKDSRGDLWLGSVLGAVIRFHIEDNKFQTFPPQPMNNFAELSSNKMLMSCTDGLVLLNAENSTTERLLQGYLMHDLLVKDGNVWIGTSGNGLICFNLYKRTTEIFTKESGLPSEYVNSIADADGYLWLGTESGLCRFDPVNKTGQTYNAIFPLSRVSYNLNAHNRLKNGQLIFGTGNGAVLFNPSDIQQLQQKGKIFFQDVFISGRSVRDSATIRLNTPVDSLKNLKLKYDQNSVTLELIPIEATEEVKFSWKMEGLDKGWSHPSSIRVINYTNIPTGTFRLKIRLYDNSLSNVLDERELTFKVIPPFWQTWWFILLITGFIFGFIFFIFWNYFIRLRQKHAEEKVQFFANTAHDVRTALTLIKAPIEEMNKNQSLNDLGRYYLQLVTEQTQRLSKVVTQLLDFQKMDIGKEQISFVMTDIVKLVAHRKLMFEPFAKSKDIEILFTSNESVYTTAIDESMMEKVVDNLISNAIKYSHPNSEVNITMDCRKKEWTLAVKDKGIGISKQAQQRLFHKFYRSENAINHKISGSGIGLMLVKNYVDLHGGNISCESQENEGSTFTISVPFREVSEKIIPVQSTLSSTTFTRQPPEGGVEAKSSSGETTFDVSQLGGSSPFGGSGGNDKMRILIVEDNDDLRNFMRYALSEEFEVSTAEDGVEAWNIISKRMPDLVVSDVMMPNMDGFELCRLIKSNFETSHIPVILLTSLSGKVEQLQGLGLGAEDYLTKPFDMSILQQRIKSIIKNREIVRERALKMLQINNDDTLFTNKLNDSFVKKAVEVIHTNLANPDFGKEDFADAMNVSSSLLYKKIKALTDQSPVDFVKAIRLNYARELLQTHQYTVNEVSENCGFADAHYFSIVFKKHFGTLPSQILN